MSADSAPDKSVFNEISEAYHTARPSYPKQLVEDLIKETGLSSNSNVLEIGIGTGKLTESLVKRGLNITGIELGERMASTAEKNLSAYEGVEIVVGNFNQHNFSSEAFDAVIAATSFHWLEAKTRVLKISDILRSGGSVAIIDTRHVDAGADGFPVASQKCYRKWNSNTPENYRLPSPDEVAKEGFRRKEEFLNQFDNFFERSYFANVFYTSEMYVKLLTTYSDVIAMDEQNRLGLLKCIGDLIDSDFGGRITKSYLWQLFIAKKK